MTEHPTDLDLDDLLRPVLSADDDVEGLGRPWRPWSLVVLAVFGGLLAAGPLAAWNFRSLGQPRRTLPALLACVLAWLAVQTASYEIYGRERLAELRTAKRPVAVRVERQPEPVPPQEWNSAVGLGGGVGGRQSPTEAYQERRRIWRPILRIVEVLPVLWIAALQRRRFRLFEGTGADPRSLWLPGIVAAALAFVASIGVLPVLYAVLDMR
jgi:hypothetical protein